MTKKEASYAKNRRKWTPARHKQFQAMWARKRAKKKQADEAALEQQRAAEPRFQPPSPETSILPNNAAANASPSEHFMLMDQIATLRRKNDVLVVKVQLYEDLLLRALKED